jgi:hypothetical protein
MYKENPKATPFGGGFGFKLTLPSVSQNRDRRCPRKKVLEYPSFPDIDVATDSKWRIRLRMWSEIG